MQLSEILKQPEGFTPPDVTVTIEKVWDYHSGQSKEGPWSFQDIQVVGTSGRLKLKGLPEFPKDREGMTVTISANQSKQHGLTGMKVAHEPYNGKTYDKLIITPSAKWSFAVPGSSAPQAAPAANGERHWAGPLGDKGKRELSYVPPAEADVEPYMAHLLGCASLAGQVATKLKVSDDQALQACFATICIDTKNRGILLPSPNGNSEPEPEPESSPAPWEQEDDGTDPF